MTNKQMYIAIVTMVVLVTAYQIFLLKYVKPRHPEYDWGGKLNQPSSTTQPEATASTTEPATRVAAATGPSSLHAIGAATTQPSITLGSDKPGDPEIALGIDLSPIGAAVESATINNAKNVDGTQLYLFQAPYGPDGDFRALATQAIVVKGPADAAAQSVDLDNVAWRLDSTSNMQATFSIDIAPPTGPPILRIYKTYQLSTRGPEKGRNNTAAGYELSLSHRIVDLTDHPMQVHLQLAGPTMPPQELERYDDRAVILGYTKPDQNIEVVQNTPTEFNPGTPPKQLQPRSNGNRLAWVGESSVYFAAIFRPSSSDQIANAIAYSLNSDPNSANRQIALQITTSDQNVSPEHPLQLDASLFMGPKQRDLLEGDYYSATARQYNQLFAVSASFCGICAFPWLVDFLVTLLRFFHFVTFGDWGLAIILLVMLVRAILHPITKSSQVSMLRMQKMAPELERLKKKYGDDKEAFSKAQMELYKEIGATPWLLGCLPMFLQMPIWVALYSGLQSEYSLRQAQFLWGLTWIHDLARPDRLISWDKYAFTIPIIHVTVASLNILPILIAGVMYVQQKLQPQPPAQTPEQEKQRKMMQWMSVVFAVFLYSAPSGLNLYILTSSIIGIIESKVIRAHIKRREEEERASKIIVDAKQTRASKQRQQDVAKPSGKKNWFTRLQQWTDELRREAERRNRDRK